MANTCFPQFANSVFRQPLPANPNVASNSAAIVQFYIDDWALNTPQNGTYDVGWHPKLDTDGDLAAIAFAHDSDPVFTIHCTVYKCPGIEGLQIHIPAGARWEGWPSTKNDCHLMVVSPDAKTLYSFWQASGCLDAGSTCNVSSGVSSEFATGNGFSAADAGSVAEASGWMATEGLILPDELAAGVIPHALSLGLPCHDAQYVPPAVNADGWQQSCSYYAGDAGRPNVLTMGQRVFLNATDAQIGSWPVQPYTKIIATALAHYGAYFTTTEGYGGAFPFGISHVSYVDGGLQDQWPSYAASIDGGIPQTDVGGGYDMGMDSIPGGWASWLSVCDRSGC